MSASRLLLLVLIALLMAQLRSVAMRTLYDQTDFDQNYDVVWGGDHVKYIDNGRLVQLSMDKASGSGFRSKRTYNSGFFRLAIKIPSKDTAGIVTAFYLSSTTNHHDELDFEFMGNKEGKPVTLQTNIFTNGHGNREQRLHLWFDPSMPSIITKCYGIPTTLWFFVDDIPIRVFENQKNRGVEYPSQPMQVLASLWNAEDWATNGGKDKINWAEAPFIAQFQDFSVDGCPSDKQYSCSSSDFWWNVGMFKDLTPAQQIAYHNVKKRLSYDYCSDKQRFKILPPECNQ